MLPHRESKDVFILGGTDDIQVLLDDSIVSERMTRGISVNVLLPFFI